MNWWVNASISFLVFVLAWEFQNSFPFHAIRKWFGLNVRRVSQKRINVPALVRELLARLRAGQTLDTAIQNILLETPSPSVLLSTEQKIKIIFHDDEWILFQTLLLSARQYGATLADVLEEALSHWERNKEMEEKLLALTAQTRVSAGVVAAAPLGFLVVMAFLNRDFIRPLFTTVLGQLILAVSLALEVAGFIVMRTLLKEALR